MKEETQQHKHTPQQKETVEAERHERRTEKKETIKETACMLHIMAQRAQNEIK